MQSKRDPLKELVRHYRTAIEPDPAHVERERARLLARLEVEAPAKGPSPRRVHRLWLVAAVAAGLLLVWGALGLYIDARVQQAVDASLAVKQASEAAPSAGAVREAGPKREVVVVAPPAAEEAPGKAPMEPGDAATAESQDEPSKPALEAPAESHDEPTTTPNRAPRRRDADVDADALLRESALLSSARAAQARGDWEAVLGLVDAHRKAHPQGVLLEERLVLEAAAACHAGQRARGEKAVQTLQRRFPRSLALARVVETCRSAADE